MLCGGLCLMTMATSGTAPGNAWASMVGSWRRGSVPQQSCSSTWEARVKSNTVQGDQHLGRSPHEIALAKLSLSHSEANTFTCGSFVICATACHCLAKSPSLPNYIDLSIRSTWRHKFVWNCSNWSWSATSAGNGRWSIPSSHLKQKPTRRLLSSCLPTYLRCLFYYMFYSCRLVWFFVQVLLYSRTCLCQNFVVTTCNIGYGLTKVWAYCRYARPLRESKITPTTRGVGWIMDISKMELWCAYWLVSYLQSNERAKIHMEAAPQKKNKSPSKPNVTSH